MTIRPAIRGAATGLLVGAAVACIASLAGIDPVGCILIAGLASAIVAYCMGARS